MDDLTHFNADGRARMVDVGGKAMTHRTAVAQARVLMQPETLIRIQEGRIAKGDVLAVAQVAGTMGAKRTPDEGHGEDGAIGHVFKPKLSFDKIKWAYDASEV